MVMEMLWSDSYSVLCNVFACDGLTCKFFASGPAECEDGLQAREICG